MEVTGRESAFEAQEIRKIQKKIKQKPRRILSLLFLLSGFPVAENAVFYRSALQLKHSLSARAGGLPKKDDFDEHRKVEFIIMFFMGFDN